MSQQVDGMFKSITAGEALEAFTRVKLAAGPTLVYADDENEAIGVVQKYTANEAEACVKMIPGNGTYKVVAAGAITAGNAIYAAADGKVEAAGTIIMGYALETSTADGDVIESILW